ncbi:DUF4349 domain-containing protein [Aquirhabdus parva]|uniref:DUF4349 domain-containing protein n=1 Tax=Aquirhabdus parva TaxID=2283318 RepID=A0A345P3J1_9GAMM|nr:DUF4349 domain-containing protein [Aquirhabdus parva]AXI01850.1 DUF4349 domain-containing protein [Aquirhabdus parva]
MSNASKVSAVALSTILLISCSKKAEQSDSAQEAMAPAPQAASGEMVAGSQADAKSASFDAPQVSKVEQLTSTVATYNDVERKFIRTATVNFGVKDVYQSALAIEDAAAAQGGFVTKNDIKSTPQESAHYSSAEGKIVDVVEYAIEGQLVVRIPSQKTQDFLRAIVTQIEFLENRSFEAHDAQFEMLRQQLEAIRQQLAQAQLSALAQQKGNIAQKTDAIDASTQSKAARDEALIKQKEFEDQVAFATITIDIHQPNKVRKTESNDLNRVVAESRPNFFKRLADSLLIGWYGVVDFLIEFMKVWPLWLFIGLVTFGIYRFRKGRKLVIRSKGKENQSDKNTSNDKADS